MHTVSGLWAVVHGVHTLPSQPPISQCTATLTQCTVDGAICVGLVSVHRALHHQLFQCIRYITMQLR